MSDRQDPFIVDLDDDAPSPAEAPPVPETDRPTGAAMTRAAALAARPPSPLARWFWRLGGALVAALVTLAAWRFVEGLLAANPLLGWAFTVLIAAFAAVCAALALREARAFSRLKRLDRLQHAAALARSEDDLDRARRVAGDIARLYADRGEAQWGNAALKDRQAEVFDAGALLDLTERSVLAPLDAAARAEVESAARHVATVTALVPMAFADVAAALVSNLRMIRRIADIYGGRSGVLGTWRLTRAVTAHLVATGAIAVGDDMLEPVLGGTLLGRLSRRFGEGLVNGALTARVGVAAMEVCRPMPFATLPAPSTRQIVRRALAGLVPGGARPQA